ncbi:MAG: hypothetical protein AB7K24_27290 [Gemmataceae bacterium]
MQAFCAAEAAPAIAELLAWFRDHLRLPAKAVGVSATGLKRADWNSFELVYQKGKPSILVECWRNAGKNSPCQQTIDEELEALQELPSARARKKLREAFKRTRFIVCCRVDGDDGHAEAFVIRTLLDYFVDHGGAVIEVEDEGFYSCSDLPLLSG